MTFTALAPIFATMLFGIIAIVFSYREERTQKLLIERERKLQHRLYELFVLKEIQDKISYSLDVEKIIAIIMNNLHNLLSFSTISSLLMKNTTLEYKTYLHEGVNQQFIDQTKQHLLAGLCALIPTPLPETVTEEFVGEDKNENNHQPVQSFFQIPFFIDETPIGIINVSSTKINLYKGDETIVLYQIIQQASHALTKLQNLLTAEQGKLMAMVGSLADGIFMIDAHGKLVIINEAATSFLRLNQSKTATIEDIYASLHNVYDLKTKCADAVTARKSIEEKELHFAEKTFQVIINPVMDLRTNKSLGVSVLMHDITAEKSLQHMKDDFTNIVVHELRAPLTAIKDASSLLVSSPTMTHDEQSRLLTIVNQQAHKLLDQVSTILDAAKFDAGKFTLQKSSADIKKIIKERLEFFLPQAQKKNIHLLANLDEQIPDILIDTSRIDQVINNLLSNSLKFTPEGGKIVVSITTSKDEQPNNKHTVTISVSDTGIGIPKEKQATLFHRYMQVEAQQPGKTATGTGLGLYVVRKIVEAHQGTVILQSEVGHGTTISFTIPYGTDVTAQEETHPTQSAVSHAPMAYHRIVN